MCFFSTTLLQAIDVYPFCVNVYPFCLNFDKVWIVLPAALQFLVNPFDILITVCFVFGGCSVFGVGMITYRNGYSRRTSLFRSFLNQLINAPIMLMFFSHVLWHLTVVCFR